jgi:hypothetical protein
MLDLQFFDNVGFDSSNPEALSVPPKERVALMRPIQLLCRVAPFVRNPTYLLLAIFNFTDEDIRDEKAFPLTLVLSPKGRGNPLPPPKNPRVV